MSTSSSPSAVPALNLAGIYVFHQALHALAARNGGEPGGKLLLYGRLDSQGYVAALAGNIAGAATLGIDERASALKQAVRDGVCDFMVNTLDEALRTLKNEIRKKQPVSVCLHQPCASALAEAVERGLQPDFLAVSAPDAESAVDCVEKLILRGAVPVSIAALPEDEKEPVWWSVGAMPALWLPKLDTIAAQVIPTTDRVRQRWLRFAPRYLGRMARGVHYASMTAAEFEAFAAGVREQVASGNIETNVLLECGGEIVAIPARA